MIRLEWSFIRTVLEKMGFCDTWIQWMMQCVSTVHYSFLFNNEAVGKVIPQRGIRQGDPLSPYIFILCVEVLSGLCKKAHEDGSLPGLIVARNCPKLNHLLFADDTMIFTKTDARSCSTLVNILRDYGLASGQMINAQKSSISFSSKTPADIRARVKAQLGIDKEGGVGKYLGLPEHFGRKKKDLFSSIVDRMKQDLQAILSKSPFHFKRWMLILQLWEPIVSDTFPSCISFWIKVHGVPLHYWLDETFEAIVADLGSI